METDVRAQADTQGAGNERVQAVELPEHLVGEVDAETYSKLPAEAREALSTIGKSLKGNYTRKYQEIAELKKLKDDLDADPKRAEFLKRSLADYAAGKHLDAKESKADKSRLDALLDEVEPSQRKAVKEFIDGLDERYQSKLSKQEQELSEIKQSLQGLHSSSQLTRRESLEGQLKSLPKGFKELALKHEEEILRIGTQPSGSRLSMAKLVQIVADPDDYRAAILASPEQAKEDVTRVKQTATKPPTGTVKEMETLVGKEDVIKSRDRKYGDRINLGNVVSKILGDVKRGMSKA